MHQWESDLEKYMDGSYPEIGKDIADKRIISPETEKKLRDALSAFKASWQS